jgi:aminoglycoside 6-adenylyltransferase
VKTRTEDEMMALILSFARVDERVRAVLMNGSRVNPRVAGDVFQDYDIVYLVTDVAPFLDRAAVVPFFGNTIIVEEPEGMLWPPPATGGHYNYQMLFTDGNRLDLTFSPLDSLEEMLSDSLTRVLLDKDDRIPDLPPPSERSYYPEPPTQKLYGDCCNSFLFGLAAHVPKTIWRSQLPLLKYYIGVVLREPLVKMPEWDIAAKAEAPVSVGMAGKHLQQLLPPDVWHEFERSYTDADYERIWESLFVFYRLFRSTAESVGRVYGYRFPDEEAEKVLAFLEHVRHMPADAQSIYLGTAAPGTPPEPEPPSR